MVSYAELPIKVKFHACHYSFIMKFVYPCVVQGFHVYRVYWDPVIGEKLTTQPDPDGRTFGDKHSVAVMKDGMTVGHLPKDISCLAKYFIVHGGKITCRVTGKKKRSKMLRGGLEVPCTYEFTMKEKMASPSIGRLKDKLGRLEKTW